jgi:hypothetical protein
MVEPKINKIASTVRKAPGTGVYDHADSEPMVPLLERKRVNSYADFVRMVESGEIDVDARVLAMDRQTQALGMARLNSKQFVEAHKKPDSYFKEGFDGFATDQLNQFGGTNLGLVGNDFIPLLGGPFYKQLYNQDYITQANAAFFASNHDPIARAAIDITSNFTLGRGYRVDCDNSAALAVWRAFEKVNDLQSQMHKMSREIQINGEVIWWWLPDNNAKLTQRPYPGQEIPKAFLPRLQLIDSTVIYDIITPPEDVNSPLYYVWMAPTQYQVFAGMGQSPATSNVPTAKFIFQQIPAAQMMHFKVNAFSNEKRGRSDLFPVLGYMKRLRDSVNYAIIALQKQSSYCIDTTINGDQTDIDQYIDQQNSLGQIPPAGSEFVHTEAIKRQYLGAEGAKTGASPSFEWCLSMISAGLGIPVSYLGTHLSGGQTRASAIVSTEPVAKKFEQRQKLYENMILEMWDYLMNWAGLGSVECEVTFPELITQDRSAKFKDLALAQSQGWISKKTAATIASKDLNITSFEYEDEQAEMAKEPQPTMPEQQTAPFSAEPAVNVDRVGVKANG